MVPLLDRCRGRVHLGCNTVKVDGFVNVDVRPTTATDVIHDCSDLAFAPDSSVNVVYSNAFFEHVYVSARLKLLRDIWRALRPDGYILFTGLPDFEGIARAYLERRKPGHVSPVFDLYEVYRYTHGDPEGAPDWWLAQLHKGLFDTETLKDLLKQARFAAGTIFGYCWGAEPHAVTLGCVAYKSKPPEAPTLASIETLTAPLPSNINARTLSLKAEYLA
jgi:predicted SAM-dependent methyltransferase